MEGEEGKSAQPPEPVPPPQRFKFPPVKFPDLTKVPPHRIVFLVVLLGILIYLQWPVGKPEFKPSREATKQQLIDVIEAQLTAFRANDWQKAHSFAAAPIQREYSAKMFEEMVRKGYPVIARSVSAQFGVATDNGTEAAIDVIVFAKGGQALRYHYFLIREDGKWKINGVQEVRAAGQMGWNL